MRSATTCLCLTAVLLAAIIQGRAQERPATASTTDPRVGLKAGFKDAGEASKNMERIANLPKPEGFFDPKAPSGNPAPPERPETPEGAPAGAAGEPAAAGATPAAPAAPRTPPPFDPVVSNRPGFTNSDLAFRDHHVFVGNYHGFNTYDIERPSKPKLSASVVCPGGQGDVSVHGNLLFMSVEQTRGRLDCGTQGVQTAVSAERFRGVRIFDISDMSKPKQVAAIQTCRGSHTHTLVVDPKDKTNLYVYGSGTSSVRSAEELAGCSGLDPKEDPNTSLFSIDVIQVPLAAPSTAHIVNRPRIFADEKTGALGGLWQGGNHGPGTQTARMTNQCHDITVFSEIGLAAGACSGNGILLDISDPVHPVRLDAVVDSHFAYWHSATFNNDGTKVVFTDEWGGGSRPRCRATDLLNWGADAIFDIVDRKLKFAGYFKMPARADRPGELRRAQRLAHPGAGARHHGPGVVPGRLVGVRFHRLGEAGRDRLLRPRSARREAADHRRVLVHLLVQRQHLRRRDRPRHRRVQAHAERVSVAERDRRRDAGAIRRAQYPAAGEDRVAGRLGGGAVPMSIS